MSFLSRLTFIILFSFTLNLIGQGKREKAVSDILMLKNGVLLVKLKTSDNLINALKKAGKPEEAEKAKMEQEAQNADIIKAFKENYSFSKVYFFYSRNSIDIKKGDFKNFLMNSDLQKDSIFTGNDYLVGEFGESATSGIEGFIVQDGQFTSLRSPFPFLIRVNKGVKTRTNSEIIKDLNDELFEFYNKVK